MRDFGNNQLLPEVRMAGRRRVSRARWRGVAALVGATAFLVGIGAGVTSAAWVDDVWLAATTRSSEFDIQARFGVNVEGETPGGSTAPWEDVGLPGNPDTYLPGFEVQIPPISDVLPGHSYFGDVFLCNAGDVDGVITNATLTETSVVAGGGAAPRALVVVGSIEVDGIDVGTVIPANSCEPASVEDPVNDVEGVIHFTTVDDFTGVYGATTTIVIRIEVTSQ
jgi:hypothetical protein